MEEKHDDEIENRNISSAKKKALRLLEKRSLSVAEIRKRLIDRGFAEDIADLTSKWLVETGLLNDEEYACGIISHCRSYLGVRQRKPGWILSRGTFLTGKENLKNIH